MQIIHKRFILLILATILLFNGCENPITGYGPQPKFLDKQDHQPLLNIFGILRPETEYNVPLSFIHVEGTFSVTSDYPDSFTIADAKVVLTPYENNVIKDSIHCRYTDFNLPNLDFAYRPQDFYPLAEQFLKLYFLLLLHMFLHLEQ